MNVQEFAKICGVSAGTVSRALSNPGRVNRVTRERILALAEQYSFRVNRSAAAAFNGVTRAIGVLVYNFEYGVDIANGIQEELAHHNYTALIQFRRWDNCAEKLRQLHEHRVAGIIMSDIWHVLSDAERKEFELMNIPCVLISGEPGVEPAFDRVNSDEEQGGTLAAEHLLENGCRSFACVGGSGHERDRAFCTRIRAAGWEPLVFTTLEEFGKFLRDGGRTEAVFCYSDYVAAKVYQLLYVCGLRIPGDVQVVGFCDLTLARLLTPPLTTIRQDGFLEGREAAKVMLARLKTPETPLIHQAFPVSLTIRESTRKIG